MAANITYITTPKFVYQKSFEVVIEEICEEVEPKPVFCELPDELIKLRTEPQAGTPVIYTYTTSSGTSGFGTSTTTTF